MRGLREELGITVGPERLAGPLAPARRRELHVPGRFRDCEFVETYRHAPSPCTDVAAWWCALLEGDSGPVALQKLAGTSNEMRAVRQQSEAELVRSHTISHAGWMAGTALCRLTRAR